MGEMVKEKDVVYLLIENINNIEDTFLKRVLPLRRINIFQRKGKGIKQDLIPIKAQVQNRETADKLTYILNVDEMERGQLRINSMIEIVINAEKSNRSICMQLL